MKSVVVFSHAGVLEVNRALFQVLARECALEVTMVVPASWKGDLIADLKYGAGESDRGLRVIPLEIAGSGNGSLFFYLGRVNRALRGVNADHVFVDEEPWSMSALQAFESLGRVPHSFYTKQNLRKSVPPPFSAIQKKVFKAADRAFAVSAEVADVLRWKGYQGPIHELPHSYDSKLFRRLSPEQKREARRRLGFADSGVLIGYIGRMAEEKGVGDLIDAMRMACAREGMRAARFAWVGNGPLFGDVLLASLDMKLGFSSVAPAIKHGEVSQAIGALDILVLPSRTTPRWKEQFGRIIIEALGCGVPVVGSDSGEIPKLIERTGGGVVFREGDAADLVAKIETLACDHGMREKLGRTGERAASKLFTHEAVARLLFEILSGQKS